MIIRLLATSILIAIAAIAATAWFTARTTTRAIAQQQGRSLADDTLIYDTLIGFAATHSSWDDVSPTVAELGRRTGHRVTLLTRDRQPIADSSAGPSLQVTRPSAVVDPLRVNPDSTDAGKATIDARAVGPYRLPARERRELDDHARQSLACVKSNVNARLTHTPSGRPVVTPDPFGAGCESTGLQDPTPTEVKALRTLRGLMGSCLGQKLPGSIYVDQQFAVLSKGVPLPRGISLEKIQRCLLSARQVQLTPYVAPAALLFITDHEARAPATSISLTRSNVIRIAVGTGLVLIIAVAVTLLVGTRLVRPLRRLTASVRRPVEQQSRVPVGARDEIGYLAVALNDLFDRRETLEAQRKALVSDLAHELRTPLTNIRGSIEAAQDGMTPTDAKLLDVLLEETSLLQRVVDDLRDLAAADTGDLQLYPEYVYVNDVLTQVADAHRRIAESQHIRLSTDFTVDPQLSVDPVRLRQIVGNLVTNAIRHTDNGGVITLRTAATDDQFIIEVTDTGTGIAPADLPRIFDRFWRADSSRSRTTGGSGLGLAIVRKLIEAHDGHITATSRLGIGSTFTITLPRARQAPA
ncbi:sensor histidine kinase [Actinoplanes awajinensis]|uniref:sensor histidine kinase n=1 Tax=Actinoplanes awajinensis TaxID=135946 RepID=UPI001E33F226|nr:HAMP domain-containing sensor histidine kinase [Actinoplanes awajinensis]